MSKAPILPIDEALYEKGYKQAEQDILAVVQENIDRAAKCMDEATGFEEYPYWDGAHDMANAIRRQICEIARERDEKAIRVLSEQKNLQNPLF